MTKYKTDGGGNEAILKKYEMIGENMGNMDIIKIGSVELTVSDAEKYYEQNKYICTNKAIYKIFINTVSHQYCGKKVMDAKGFAGIGRFYALDAASVNHVMGKEVITEEF